MTKVLSLPLGFHKKTTFPPEFCNEICIIYVLTIKSIILKKNNNVEQFQNGCQITDLILAKI